MGAEHVVEHLQRDLRVHQVAVRRADAEGAPAQRSSRVGDDQLRIEAVLDAEPLTRRARPLAELNEKRRGSGGRRRAPRRAARTGGAGLHPVIVPTVERGFADARWSPPPRGRGRRSTSPPAARPRPRTAWRERRQRLEEAALPLAEIVSNASDDLPEPDTPVITVSRPPRDLDVEPLEVVLSRAAHREHRHHGRDLHRAGEAVADRAFVDGAGVRVVAPGAILRRNARFLT